MCSYSGKRKCNSKTVALIPEARAMCVDVRAVDTETRTIGIEGGASNLLKEIFPGLEI